MNSQARTSYEKYFEDPLKYAQIWFDEANNHFNGLSSHIQRNFNHYCLTSDHIKRRSAEDAFRSHIYFPALHPAIQAQTDLFMEIYASGDPVVVGECNYQDNIDPRISDLYDASANRWERLMNANIEARYARHMDNMEQFFIGCCLYNYSTEVIKMKYRFEKVTMMVPVPKGFDPITGRPIYDLDFGREMVFKMPYPEFEYKPPERCRIDMGVENPAYWRYCFPDIEDITDSEMMDNVDKRGWSKKQVEKILSKSPSQTLEDARSSKHTSYSGGDSSDSINTYRHVTGYIRLFNPQEGHIEIREIHFIEGADQDIALLEEKPYEYDISEFPTILSKNYVVPGRIDGQSTADVTSELQNFINEAINSAVDADSKAIDSPMVAEMDALIGPLRWGHRQVTKIDSKGQGVDRVIGPLITPPMGNTMMEKAGFAEERLNYMSNAMDVITGRESVGDRKDTTLGKENMRLNAAIRGIARMIVRHARAITAGFNTALEMQKAELMNYIEMDEQTGGLVFNEMVNHEDGQPEVLNLDPNIDFRTPVKLRLHDNIKAYMSKETELAKTIDTIRADRELFPHFVGTNPEGEMELRRRIFEAAQMKGIDEILGTDKGQIMMNMQQMQQQNQKQEVA